MKKVKEIDVTTRKQVRMLLPDVAQALKRFHWHWRFVAARCLMKNDDHGPQGITPPIIPYAPMKRVRIYTGTRESGSYNHHSQIMRFKDRYYFAWSNGRADEEVEGQRIMIVSSTDGLHWSDPRCVIGGEAETTVIHNCVALYAGKDRLFIVDWCEECVKDATMVGMRRIIPEKNRLDILASVDGADWKPVRSLGERLKVIFEAPRPTADGRLMCVCTTSDHQPGMLVWPGMDLCVEPEVVSLPTPAGAAFPSGEGSWYQTEEGRIVVFWRDESGSCRVWVNYSDDGGRTFVPPMISDIPDSMSRVYAGRLADGRYYLCNNAFATLLDRRHLLLFLSDNGCEFNKVLLVVDDPTSQRLKGLLKVDGYQYPCCLAEPGKLFVGYSINKEDIECGIVDTAAL
ncbi:MAG: exo-alpha-sialidase [Planctomycetota bacterium]